MQRLRSSVGYTPLSSALKQAQSHQNHVKLLIVLCTLLALYLVYDICCHYQQAAYLTSLRSLELLPSSQTGQYDGQLIARIIEAPGSPDGKKLRESSMFLNVDYTSSAFLSPAGLLVDPFVPQHTLDKTIKDTHVGTLLGGHTRGNHRHVERIREVLVLIYGRFQLRVGKITNDGSWLVEDHYFEVGVTPDPFSSYPSTISTAPIGIQIEAGVCHALKNFELQAVEGNAAFFISYFIMSPDAKRPEPEREICKHPSVFLQ